MNTDNTFQNDMFATVLMNPQSKFEDFVAHGYNSDNTGLLTPEEYKKLDKVQEAFTQDGVFNEEAFNNAYLTAAYTYNALAEGDLFKKLEEYVEYSPVSMYAPLDKNTSDWTPSVEKIRNPFESTYGLNSLFGETETEKSKRELAQTNTHYFDWNEQKWVEESPDDFGLSGFVKPAMVYAVWQSDGYHVDQETGKTVAHQKGDWKTDKDGKFYMETVGDRESYGMETVSSWDTLTSEGSFLNSINVFESDDKEKSIAGTTFKLFFNVLPYFIPGLNTIYGGIHMAYGLASIIPTVYKSVEGMILGGDNKDYDEHNALWQAMTKAENWFKKIEFSTSDEAKGSLMNYEQIGQIVGDVFSQIYEQRAAASIAGKIIGSEKNTINLMKDLQKKYGNEALIAQLNGTKAEDFFSVVARNSSKMKQLSERQSKLAKQLSLGYMALTQSSEVYQQGLEAGYDRRAAGITSLLAMGGQYMLMMNNKLGDWFLDKTTGYVKDGLNKEIKSALLKVMPDVQKAVNAIDKATHSAAKIEAKKGLVSSLIKAKDKIVNLIKNGPNDYLGNAGIEAIEEVTEEAAIDLAKGVTDTLSWLGVWRKQGDYFKDGFLTQQTFERYLTSAIGGAIGGALFELNTNVISPKINGEVAKNNQRDIIELVRDGHVEEVLKEIDKLGLIGNTKSTPIKLGDLQLNIGTPAETLSTTQQVANTLKDYVQWVDGVLNQGGLKHNNQEIITNALITHQAARLFKESGLDKFVIEDFTNYAQQYVDVLAEFENTEEDKRSPELKKKVEEARQKASDIVEGKKAEHYMQVAALILNPDIKNAFDNMSLKSFAEAFYNKEITNITEEELKTIEEEYKKYIESSDVLEYLNTRVEAFKNLENKFSNVIKDYVKSNYINVRRKTFSEFIELDKLTALNNQLVNYINFDNLKALIETIPNEELQFELSMELEILAKKWENKDSGVIQEAINFLYKIKESSKNKDLVDQEIINLNQNKNLVYNLLDQIHSLELGSNAGIVFDNFIKGNVFELLDKNGIFTNKFNEIIKIIEWNNIKLTDEEKEILKTNFQNKISNKFESIPAYKLSPKSIDYILKSIATEAKQNLETTLNLINELKIKLDEGEITTEQFIEQSQNLYIDTAFYSRLDFSPLDYYNWKIYIKGYNKEDLDFRLNENGNDFNAIKDEDNENDEFDEYYYSNEFYSNDLNLYDAAFLKYYESLDTVDGVELEKYINLKIEELIKTINKEEIKKFIDIQALKLKLKEEYYNGKDIIELIKKEFNTAYNKYKIEQETKGLPVKTFRYTPEDDITVAKLKPFEKNGLYETLKKLNIFINSNNSNIFDLLENLQNKFNKLKFSEFTTSNIELKDINDALKTLKMLKGLVTGMIDYEVTYETPFGFNTSIIKFLNKYHDGKNVEKYSLISEKEALVLYQDIKALENRLEFVKTLQDLNSGSQLQKDTKMQENFQNIIFKRFKGLGSLTIDGTDILEKIKDVLSSDIENDEKLLKIEDYLFDFVNNDKEKFKKLIEELKLNKDSIIKKQSLGLSETTTEIYDYDFLNWLAAICSVKSSDFHRTYINYIETQPNNIAPLYGQKLALQLCYSFLKSENNLFKSYYDTISSYKNPYCDFLFYVQAIGGAGKSSVIARTTYELLKFKNKEVGVLSPNESATARLKESIFKNTPDVEPVVYTAEELLRKCLKSGSTDETVKKLLSLNTSDLVTEDQSLKKLKINNATELILDSVDLKNALPKVVFIDEVTNFGTPFLQFLNVVGSITKTKFVLLGDEAQLGLENTVDDIVLQGSIKLSFSMRYSNILKGQNDKQISNFLQQTINTKILPNDNEYIPKIQKEYFRLSYYQNSSELIGDKIVKDLTGELNVFKNIIETNPEEKLLIITETGTITDKLEDALNSVGITSANYRISSINPTAHNSVQGDEANYVIVDSLSFTQENAFINFKKFYTTVSRSLKGSLFYDPNSILSNLYNITSIEKPYEPYILFDSEIISDLKQKIITRYKEILPPMSLPTTVTPTVTPTITVEPESTTPMVKSETMVKPEPEPELTIEPEKKETVDEDYDENSNEDNDDFDDDSAEVEHETVDENPKTEDTEQKNNNSEPIKQNTEHNEENNDQDDNEESNNQEKINEIDSSFKNIMKKSEEKIQGNDDGDDNFNNTTPFNKKSNELGVIIKDSDSKTANNPITVRENKNNDDFISLRLYTFYNRLNCQYDSERNYLKNGDSNEDLNIFNAVDGKYSKSQINSFLFFKNMLSLYSEGEIKNFLNKKTNQSYGKIISQINQELNCDLNELSIGDIYLQAKKYNQFFDESISTFKYGESSSLNNDDVFISLMREVKIKDKSYFITIGVFPKKETLSTALQSGSINQKTFDTFESFEDYLSNRLTNETQVRIPLYNANQYLQNLKQIIKSKGDLIEEDNMDLNSFSNYLGLYFNKQDIKVLSENGKGISPIEYIDNVVENLVSKDIPDRNSEIEKKRQQLNEVLYEEKKDEFGNIDKIFKLRGRPVLQVYVTPEIYKYIPIYPKSRSFEEALQELDTIPNSKMFMDYNSTLELLYKILPYKDIFINQLNKFYKSVSDTKKDLKRIIQNTINFLENTDYDITFDQFKKDRSIEFSNSKLFRYAGYLICQQINNLNKFTEEVWYVTKNPQRTKIALTSFKNEIKQKLYGMSIYYNKAGQKNLNESDKTFKLDFESSKDYYKVTRSIQMPTFYLEIEEVFNKILNQGENNINIISINQTVENQESLKVKNTLDAEKTKQLKDLENNSEYINTQLYTYEGTLENKINFLNNFFQYLKSEDFQDLRDSLTDPEYGLTLEEAIEADKNAKNFINQIKQVFQIKDEEKIIKLLDILNNIKEINCE